MAQPAIVDALGEWKKECLRTPRDLVIPVYESGAFPLFT